MNIRAAHAGTTAMDLATAGIAFIDENGGGAGVRLRKPGRSSPRK